MDTPKPEEPVKPVKTKKECRHAIMMNPDENAMPHWDCIYCGAVAYLNPSKMSMRIPEPS